MNHEKHSSTLNLTTKIVLYEDIKCALSRFPLKSTCNWETSEFPFSFSNHSTLSFPIFKYIFNFPHKLEKKPKLQIKPPIQSSRHFIGNLYSPIYRNNGISLTEIVKWGKKGSSGDTSKCAKVNRKAGKDLFFFLKNFHLVVIVVVYRRTLFIYESWKRVDSSVPSIHSSICEVDWVNTFKFTHSSLKSPRENDERDSSCVFSFSINTHTYSNLKKKLHASFTLEQQQPQLMTFSIFSSIFYPPSLTLCSLLCIDRQKKELLTERNSLEHRWSAAHSRWQRRWQQHRRETREQRRWNWRLPVNWV